MARNQPTVLRYRRCRFAATLPLVYRYTASHFWLVRQPDGMWRVGLTKFATRLLGETVELFLNVSPGTPVVCGQVLGSIEGFKTVSDLASVVEGVFLGGNPALQTDIALVNKDAHGDGWLYAAAGNPLHSCLSARAYARHLNRTIDKLRNASAPAEEAMADTACPNTETEQI